MQVWVLCNHSIKPSSATSSYPLKTDLAMFYAWQPRDNTLMNSLFKPCIWTKKSGHSSHTRLTRLFSSIIPEMLQQRWSIALQNLKSMCISLSEVHDPLPLMARQIRNIFRILCKHIWISTPNAGPKYAQKHSLTCEVKDDKVGCCWFE